MQELLNITLPKANKKSDTNPKLHPKQPEDEYAWLRDPKWPKEVSESNIIAHLHQENEYADKVLSSFKEQQEILFNEMRGRVLEEDYTVPVKRGDYSYYSFIRKGEQYWVHARKHKDREEEILLDANKINSKYVDIGAVRINKSQDKLLYSIDLNGSERYTVKAKDLSSGEIIDESVNNAFGHVVWHPNSSGFFYIEAPDNWRSHKVYFHKLGTPQEEDKLIYHERDDTFHVGVDISESKHYLFIETSSSDSTEIYYIDLEKGFSLEPNLLIKRRAGHLCSATHHGDYFYILTNDKGKNFRLVRTKVSPNPGANLEEIIPHDEWGYLQGIYAYQNYIVLTKKKNALAQILILNPKTLDLNKIEFTEETYSAGIIYTTFEAENIRLSFSALNIPPQVREYNFEGSKMNILKTQEVPFSPNEYEAQRLFVKASDGAQIPITLFYKKELFKKNGSNPLYLFGYGAYGISMPQSFNPNIISLVDRGFVYCIAHIRGGTEMGFNWYEESKFLNKKRTYLDFQEVAEYLIDEKYTSKGNISIVGGSAGGTLIGYAINNSPELFKVAVAHVPFVDVLNTMLDSSLPLTPGEFKEWGNPQETKFFDYIKSYSPYENVKKQSYPHLFVTAGLTDPRVGYWEPAKWVARLREYNTNPNSIIAFKTKMGAGHRGSTGRFNYLKEKAEEYAFILGAFGKQ